MRLRTFFPNMLADLKFPHLASETGAERNPNYQSRDARECDPESDIAEKPQDPELREELFVKKPIEPCELTNKPFQGQFNACSARPFPKDGMAFASHLWNERPCLAVPIKQVIGAFRQSSLSRGLHSMHGRTAYPYEHMDTASRDVNS